MNQIPVGSSLLTAAGPLTSLFSRLNVVKKTSSGVKNTNTIRQAVNIPAKKTM